MSTGKQTTRPSTSSNFTQIFDTAIDEYNKLTKQDLRIHPFAAALNVCNTPNTILDIFRTQAQAFDRFRTGDDKLMRWLNPTVHVLFTLSATLAEGIGLPFSPAKTIFTGIGVLLGTVKDIISSYDMLVNLFERIQFFVQRLKSYTNCPLTTEMTVLLGKIMAQTLSVLALSTKTMKERRIKTFMKRLTGRTDVEDALERLDTLTKEEGLMMAARNLEVTHNVDDNVVAIKEVIHDVDSNVNIIKEVTHNVDGNVTRIKEVVGSVDSNLRATTELTYQVADHTKLVETVVHRIDDNLEATKRATYELQRDQSREKLRAWLSPPNPSINHNVTCDTHHEGTATWFTHGTMFGEWKKNGSLLWIYGNPGSGKSVFCSTIIEDIKHLREANSALVTFYYFDFKDAAKRHLRGLLSSLLIQLGNDSLGCWDVLHQLYTECREGSEQPSEATLAGCIKDMLDLEGQVPIYVIIDALDECPDTIGTPSDRKKVLDFIRDLVECKHSTLSICITSRPEQDIQVALDLFTPTSSRVSLHEESGQKEDINNYVRSFVHSNEAMRRWKAEDQELVINTLTERAGGSFRWVYCQLDALWRYFPSSIRRALNELPDTLDHTYERTLRGIPKQKRRHAHRLFQCLVAAIRPLQVEELAEIFTIEFDTDATYNLVEDWRPENAQEAVLSACTTLISIIDDDEDGKIVQFSHFSVKEFLTSDRFRTSDIENNSQFYIPLGDAHTILARACLTVLLQLDETTDKRRLASFPLVFYAADYWASHAEFGEVAPRCQDAMERLLDPKKPYFASWIWIRGLHGKRQVAMDYLADHPSRPEETPLYYAAFFGLLGLVRHLVTHGEDVNANDGHGSPLHAASGEGHVDVARLLIDHGADVNLRNAIGNIPLWNAYLGRHLEVMQLLLKHGADVDMRYGSCSETLLHRASGIGQADIVHLLLQHNADVNAKSNTNRTPLHEASYRGHTMVAQLLMKYGAEVNVMENCPEAPLDATSHGHHDTKQVLLEHGAVSARGAR